MPTSESAPGSATASRAARRRLAERMDRDRAELERIGARAAARIGRQARVAVLKAFQARRSPLDALHDTLDPMTALLTDGMVAAHLQGRRRAIRTAREALGDRLRLSAYDAALAALQRQMQLSDADLSRLRLLYGSEVERTLRTLGQHLDGRLAETMQQITAEQLHVRAGVQRLKQAFEAAGITPEHSFLLETLFRTQTQLAYAAGRWNVLREEAVDEILWGFEYVTVGDDRVRPAHAAMDGIRLPKDDPFWIRSFPPNGYNCRCAAIEIFKGDAAARPDRIRRPQPREIDGVSVEPEAERGFQFNPGDMLRDQLPGSAALKRPVSSFLRFEKETGVLAKARQSVNVIERIHAVDQLPELPVKEMADEGFLRSYLGFYRPAPDGRAMEIQISPRSPHPHMTTIHELGHFLDHQGIGAPGRFASASEALLENFRQTVRQTRAYQRLVEIGQTDASQRKRRFVREYLLADHELFARAYAQFIASRASDRTIKGELEQMLQEQTLPLQWDEDDFGPVSQALEALLGKLQWLK